MLKMTMLVRRLPSLDHDEFDRYWRETHGPLVTSLALPLRIRRYVQTTVDAGDPVQDALRQARGTLAVDFDGLGELWWDSLDDYRAVRSTPEGLAAVAEVTADERRFVDLSRSCLWFGIERPMIG
ncbi:EthD domain-containing protein [Pleomorphomonas carboxyditropha]|uniref:Ethyl tert-butyl ether degradation protein EthD n=1 Tax=Pleomorphomonas carboxyditropha TaxID=2023338 RepID=A0A2G9X134_9HYPH|nr:EthD domain-containing protein [Pleomorphomonas carboxyditropha]PIP00640.1 ethyl tert-butyl ether degradation protein EthD [Pleomorphomonas carboxyditropha]